MIEFYRVGFYQTNMIEFYRVAFSPRNTVDFFQYPELLDSPILVFLKDSVGNFYEA